MIRRDVEVRRILGPIAGDGRRPLVFLGVGLFASGVVALILAASGRFLPHDERFLGMSARDLCGLHGCRIVHFMIHDRAAFGGVVAAIGMLYCWLATGPLKRREAWAWWAFLVSGVIGFASFLSYLGYGYLDVWHGLATLALLPCFVDGLILTRSIGRGPSGLRSVAGGWPRPRSVAGAGRLILLFTACGIVGAGAVISSVGISSVFVPQDLAYMGVDPGDLRAVNPRLVPLIAHDRAGFGGGLASVGSALLMVAWFAQPDRALRRCLAMVGLLGFGPAIGVHFAIGYTDVLHLAPAVLGALSYTLGLALIGPRPDSPCSEPREAPDALRPVS